MRLGYKPYKTYVLLVSRHCPLRTALSGLHVQNNEAVEMVAASLTQDKSEVSALTTIAALWAV